MTDTRFAAFAEVYARQHRPLWAYLVRLGATRTAAEDLTQEAFVKWLNHARSPDEPGQVKAFLFTTATRLLVDQWRRERRLVQWDETVPGAMAGPDMIPRRAWAALSQREQQLLWLGHAEEFSHAEIAGITGLAPASIKVLMSRARARLRTALTLQENPDE